MTRHRAVVTGGFFATLMAANLAGPLYAGYADRFGFTTAVVALVFATYAIVLIPSLLVFGQLSDRLGRRAVIAAGLGTVVIAMALFATADGVGSLFAARAVQGVAQGLMTGPATAMLVELSGAAQPRQAAVLATFAQAGGSAAGPLVGGAVAQWLPAPRVLPFAVGALACLTAAALLRAVPETRAATPGAGWRIQRPAVPRAIRADFARVALTGAAVWSVAGALFLAIVPAYAGQLFATDDLALLGAVSAAMLASSAAVQLIVRRMTTPPRVAQARGLLLLAAGLLALVLAKPLDVPALLLLGAALSGTGHGVAFLAAQDDLTRFTPAHQRGEVSAAFAACIYAGVAGPVIGVGVLATATTLYTAIVVFAAVTGAAALAVAAWHRSG